MADSEKRVCEPSHFTYVWAIENITEFCYVESPTFTVKEMEMTRWHLEIYCDIPEFVNLEICREKEDGGPESIEIKCELSFLGKDGLPLVEEVRTEKLENGRRINFYRFAYTKEIFFEKRTAFLPKDTLTVRCRMWRTGTEISQIDSCFARTRLRPDRRLFVWAIREFSTLPRDQKRIIILKETSTNQFSLNLFATEMDGEEYVSLSIENSDGKNFECCCFKICLLDIEGKVVHYREALDCVAKYFEFRNFFKKARLFEDEQSLLPNDVLTLRCEVEMEDITEWSVIENYRYFNSMSSEVIATEAGEILRCGQDETSNVSASFTEAMKSLIEEGTLSDVSLRTDSKSFPAHKCILSARSPVFKAMFTGDMKEKTSKCVEIPDVDEDTLRELLSYIYTGKVGDLDWRSATDLYRAADKYELLDLKRRCSDLLKSDLSESSVCAILSVADLHQDTKLRAAAQDFIMAQGAQFFTSDTWQKFKEEHSKIYVEILELIVSNLKNRR